MPTFTLDFWIAHRTDNVPGTGTATDPYDGNSTNPNAGFDWAMNQTTALALPVTVHIGPGEFQTLGYSDSTPSAGWQAKKGMRIIGAGMDVTKLKLIGATAPNEHFFAIGHPLTASAKTDLLEISDLTIDCNLGGNGTVACGAVRVMGDHVRIRRVKAINWGTKTTVQRCLVLAALTASPEDGVNEAMDVGIEDCIVISPDDTHMATGAKATAIHVGHKSGSATLIEKFGRGPVVRNCFIDCGRSDYAVLLGPGYALPERYAGISMTRCRAGLVEGNQVHNTDIGFYWDKHSAREVIIRNNFFKNVTRGVYAQFSGNIIDFLANKAAARVDQTEQVRISATSNELANLEVGDRVKVDKVNPPSPANGVYRVVAIDTNQGWFAVISPASVTWDTPVSTVKKVTGISRTSIENNSVELPINIGPAPDVRGIMVSDGNTDAPPYAEGPDFVHGDFIVRNNKIRYLDGLDPEGATHKAIELCGVKHAQVTHNVISSANPQPIQVKRCGVARFFNNQAVTGGLLPGLNVDTGQTQDDMATISAEVDDAILLGLLAKR